jgi:CIC family chloride channel protein
MEGLAGYHMPHTGGEGGGLVAFPSQRWLLVLVPALGGLLSGLLVYSLAPEAEGHGTDAVIDAFHKKGGRIRKRIPIIKTIASALTIGSGGSAGREGPIAQIGAGFGSALAGWLRVSDRERRFLMLAGAGAGIGAIFRAPLGGALFSVEVLYRDIEFESPALVPSFVASITAYSIYCSVSGHWDSVFYVDIAQFSNPLQLPFYILLGMICAGVGLLYIGVFYGIRDHLFKKIPIPNHVKPALGGLLVGGIGYFLPEILGMSYGWVQKAMDGDAALPLHLILTIAFVKIIATGLTISSGGSGGVFAPSMVIGGMLGAAMGILLRDLLPGLNIEPAAFALVGMAGFFAGVAKTPISSLIMVSEMTKGYELLVPLMLTTGTGYVLIPRKTSIYSSQTESRIDSPAHEGEFVIDVLEQIRVNEVFPQDPRLTCFLRNTMLSEILESVVESRQKIFPVLHPDGNIHGVIDLDDIRIFFTDIGLPPRGVIAQDLLRPNFTTVALDESLASALHKFHRFNLEELPVVEAEGSLRVIGVLSRHDIISVYHDRMYRRSRN